MLDKIIGKNKYDSPVEEAAKIYVFKFKAQIIAHIVVAAIMIICGIFVFYF